MAGAVESGAPSCGRGSAEPPSAPGERATVDGRGSASANRRGPRAERRRRDRGSSGTPRGSADVETFDAGDRGG